MKRWIKDWDDLLTYEKVFHMLGLIFSVTTIILAALSLLGLVPYWIMMFGLAAIQLCQAVYSWRNQRQIGILGLCAGTLVLAAMMVMLIE